MGMAISASFGGVWTVSWCEFNKERRRSEALLLVEIPP